MAIAESILFEINSTNYTAPIATIYKPATGNSGFVTTLKLTVNINSINAAEFPYIPDDTLPNVLEEILAEVALNTPFKEIILYFKKGNGAWMERASMRLFNKEPYYDISLIRLFSDANTIDVAEDFSLGIQLKPGNVLAAADKILVWGSVVEEKKNDPGLEALSARIEALELALAGKLTNLPANTLLGRNSTTGTVETIAQSTFAKPQDIDTAIFNLIAGAPGALNTLDELAAALGDDSNFATTVMNLIATKIGNSGNQEISGTLTATKLQSSNLWELEPRSGSSILDANNLIFAQFAGTKWIDSNSHANFPLPYGMVGQFDSLSGTATANKYRVQEFVSLSRWWKRQETNGVWGNWLEFCFLNTPQTFTATQNFTGQINVNTTKVIGPRETGWTSSTGTHNRGAFNSETATLLEVSRRLFSLEFMLRNHGLMN